MQFFASKHMAPAFPVLFQNKTGVDVRVLVVAEQPA